MSLRASRKLWLLVALAVALVAAANVHLLYVAISSQPACVAHTRLGAGAGASGAFSAAQSSCSPVDIGAPQ
ncbi:hypothetical protein S58_01280 [Bradyrhizobium oligotrophicum S58]|uniref:Uncharacterized protein n=1 Tax=Bradyrhizobium oligotrophicum S58 TaxID=1245469 RepID=M4YZX9_9BRAD|nr:hypothetical protein [Bradyrhizobium oligotrophicum]BAM86148.1 hypothetical protein S58_01280 [Bradyrhizobium oligotrophicum S58]